MKNMENIGNIAMLIDSENTQLRAIEAIIQEVSIYGRIVVKRAYGNWLKVELKNWEDEMRRLAIKPIQQIDYVKGKNTADIALTIDAMDFLYKEEYKGYALVSSDSDFTPLAVKLKEAGKFVIGVGEKKTPISFISACDDFIYLEQLLLDESEEKEKKNSKQIKDKKAKGPKKDKELDNLFKLAYENYQNDDGLLSVGAAGSYIKRVKPDFDIRNYGYKRLPEYLEAHPDLYKITKVPNKGGFGHNIWYQLLS